MGATSKTEDVVGIIWSDLDGVIWRGASVIAGVPESIAAVREAGWQVNFVTNNSSTRLADQEQKLCNMGIPAIGNVVTSAQAAASLIEPTETVLACSGPGVIEAVQNRGARVVDVRDALLDSTFNSANIDAVVVGMHRDFCFDFLHLGLSCLLAGARLIGTNDDATFPTETGILPGGGSLIASYAYASQLTPVMAGKPHHAMAQLVQSRAGSTPVARQIMVGDRPDTDGAFAQQLGIAYGQVWSGVQEKCAGPVDGISFDYTGNTFCDIATFLLKNTTDVDDLRLARQ
jgi:4-nitrophenyl phosphatase